MLRAEGGDGVAALFPAMGQQLREVDQATLRVMRGSTSRRYSSGSPPAIRHEPRIAAATLPHGGELLAVARLPPHRRRRDRASRSSPPPNSTSSPTAARPRRAAGPRQELAGSPTHHGAAASATHSTSVDVTGWPRRACPRPGPAGAARAPKHTTRATRRVRRAYGAGSMNGRPMSALNTVAEQATRYGPSGPKGTPRHA